MWHEWRRKVISTLAVLVAPLQVSATEGKIRRQIAKNTPSPIPWITPEIRTMLHKHRHLHRKAKDPTNQALRGSFSHVATAKHKSSSPGEEQLLSLTVYLSQKQAEESVEYHQPTDRSARRPPSSLGTDIVQQQRSRALSVTRLVNHRIRHPVPLPTGRGRHSNQ